MEMTQQDYETRAARLDDGTSQNQDEDRRLVEQYEKSGYTRTPADRSEDATQATSSVSAPATESEDAKGARIGKGSRQA